MLEIHIFQFPSAYVITENTIWFQKGLGGKIKHADSQSKWHTFTVNFLHSDKYLDYSPLGRLE